MPRKEAKLNSSTVKIMNLIVPKTLQTEEVREFITQCVSMIQLYAKKNHDYGNSFNQGMSTIGMMYGLGRIYDKINRAINITRVKAEVEDETIKDTVKDLACYSTMLLSYMHSNARKELLKIKNRKSNSIEDTL